MKWHDLIVLLEKSLHDIPRSVQQCSPFFVTYQIVISARIEKKDKQIDNNNVEKKWSSWACFVCLLVWLVSLDMKF